MKIAVLTALRRSATAAPSGRSPRSLFAEAHFATMPPDLAELCIKAGTSERGCCPTCGAGWVRKTEKGDPVQHHWAPGTQEKIDKAQGTHGASSVFNTGFIRPNVMLGWVPSCACYPPLENAPACFEPRLEPAVVLDPFGGAGTTGMVADRLGRNAILIELNESYAAMAANRLQADAGMFAMVAAE
jgi:hypothetical protein